MKSCLLFFLILFTFSQISFTQEIHTPSEIVDIINESEISYNIVIGKVDYQPGPKIAIIENDFYHTDSLGYLVVRKFQISEELQELYSIAEYYFENNKLEEARNTCIQVAGLEPGFLKPMVLLGSIYLKEGNLKKAEEILTEVININYIDFKAHWKLAEVYLAGNMLENASYEITIAHILNRNHMEIWQHLIHIYKRNKIKYHEWSFQPEYYFNSDLNTSVEIYSEADWLGYALCKALWNFEPSYSNIMGVTNNKHSILEEKECLANLLVSMGIDNKKSDKNDEMKALKEALSNNFIAEYIYYEIWFPDHPKMVYRYPPEIIQSIAKYIFTVRNDKRNQTVWKIIQNQL